MDIVGVLIGLFAVLVFLRPALNVRGFATSQAERNSDSWGRHLHLNTVAGIRIGSWAFVVLGVVVLLRGAGVL